MVIRKSTPIFTPGLRCNYAGCLLLIAYCLLVVQTRTSPFLAELQLDKIRR